MKREMTGGLKSKERAHGRLVLPRFLVVGLLGTITNLLIFFVLVDLRKWDPTVGSVLAFIIAVCQNYLLNHIWTFAHQVRGTTVSFKGYFRFMLVALAALGVNLVILWAVLILFDPPWKVIAQAAGIAVGTVINYSGSKLWVFKTNE